MRRGLPTGNQARYTKMHPHDYEAPNQSIETDSYDDAEPYGTLNATNFDSYIIYSACTLSYEQ